MKNIVFAILFLLPQLVLAAPINCADLPEMEPSDYANIQSFKKLAKKNKVTKKHIRLAKNSDGWKYYEQGFEENLDQITDTSSLAGLTHALLVVFGTSFDDIEYAQVRIKGKVYDTVTTLHGDVDSYITDFYYRGTETSVGVYVDDDRCFPNSRKGRYR